MKNKLIFVSILLVVLSVTTYGWNRHGHLLVSAIAYRELQKSPLTVDKLNAILKSHPDAKTWTAEYEKAKKDLPSDLTIEIYFFIRAAAWPDDVRGTAEHVETWHFINYPITLPEKIDYTIIEPANNIFDGTKTALTIIEDNQSTDKDKARMLSWLLHLIGDVHQPLHSVALNRDAGGNAQCVVKPDGRPAALHSYWDGLAGERKGAAYDVMDAWLDSNVYMHSHKELKSSDFKGPVNMIEWATESSRYALTNAYQFQNKEVPTFKKIKVYNEKKKKYERVCPKVASPLLPQGYDDEAQKIALGRILKAGYRAASGIWRIL